MEIHTFKVESKSCYNLILNLPTQYKRQPANLLPILIGADYNGVLGSVASDDNASGVATS